MKKQNSFVATVEQIVCVFGSASKGEYLSKNTSIDELKKELYTDTKNGIAEDKRNLIQDRRNINHDFNHFLNCI